MQQLSKALLCLIYTMASAPLAHGPLFVAKCDIKDGFGIRQFTQMMPGTSAMFSCPSLTNPFNLWFQPASKWAGANPPAFFCTMSKTVRDIAQHLLLDTTELPKHPLEQLCLSPKHTLPTIHDTNLPQLLQLLEVYVDDLIGLIQAPSLKQICHFTQAILITIHKIFPPSMVTQ